MPPRRNRRSGGNNAQNNDQIKVEAVSPVKTKAELKDVSAVNQEIREETSTSVTMVIEDCKTELPAPGTDAMESGGSANFEQLSADEALKRAIDNEKDAFQAASAIIDEAKRDTLPTISYKNPSMLLNEKRKGLKFETISETGDAHSKVWTVGVEIEGQMFEGIGKNKRQAKTEAAKYALIKMFNILCVPEEQSPGGGPHEGQADGSPTDTDTGEGEALLDDNMQGKKRPFKGGPGKSAKKLKAQAMPKNALMHLYELKPGIQYTIVSQVGPTHAPTFTMSVEVNGQTFSGQGNSKKTAKLAAAELALKSFLQFPNASDAHAALGHQPQMNVDFTSDDHVQNFDGKEGMDTSLQSQNGNGVIIPGSGKKVKTLQSYEGKNPIMILNELKPNLKYECVSETGNKHTKTFTIAVLVDGESFTGVARSKKLAKARAAQAALTKIFNMNFSWGPSGMPVNNSDASETYSALADHVAKLVQGKFAELTDDLTSQYARRKVLAGMVMTWGDNLENSKILCVSAGTKCINGEYLSDQGKSVNDFHAEILTRRSTLRFLYSQLELVATNEPSAMEQSIFEKADSSGYRLKEGVKFHLYISTAPCGDSRIFSPHAKQDDENESGDRHPNRKARGQLRTKIESGEGTIPVKATVGVQTWDGVIQGERLLTMSCSDKIARWNLLGIQGALMGLYVEPIYISSIILGSLYHADHLARAVYKRVEAIEGVGEPYHINKPNLSGINNPEQRQLVKAPNFAVSWCDGDSALEVINMTTGKQEQLQESRLCKRELFKRFLRLNGRLALRISLEKESHVYSELKAMNTQYQDVKNKFIAHFKNSNLGLWVKKPIEQDEFEVSDLN